MINRLVIIGNGFDLAHGLKTRYQDFISDYFSKVTSDAMEDELLSLNGVGTPIEPPNSFNDLISKLGLLQTIVTYDRHYLRRNDRILGSFKNKIFEELSQSDPENWVDIEWEYFNQLSRLVKGRKFENSELNNEFRIQLKDDASKVNQDLDLITKKLIDYLAVASKDINGKNFSEMAAIIAGTSIDNDPAFIRFLKEFPVKYHNELTKIRETRKEKLGPSLNSFNRTLLLNFNYTQTAKKLYRRKADVEEINIHGTLERLDSIVFGYGDEAVAEYSELEKLNNNEFLRHMKSFHYGRNDNYRKLMAYADSEPFQIQILGHSCGISDRTLLSSLFEHENCWSIKVYYHQWDNKSGTTSDNYQDLYMNISRHFKDKIAMRNKVVNKGLCDPLPNIKRTKV